MNAGSFNRNKYGDLSNYPSAYIALVTKQSVCCGISDAIYLLCNCIGIECEKWLTPSLGYSYNKVKIGGTWYKIDADCSVSPKIKIYNRSDIDYFNEKSVVKYAPTDRKITIYRINYRINVIAVNNHYIVDTETDNCRQTLVPDIWGNVISVINIGLKIMGKVFGNHDNYMHIKTKRK